MCICWRMDWSFGMELHVTYYIYIIYIYIYTHIYICKSELRSGRFLRYLNIDQNNNFKGKSVNSFSQSGRLWTTYIYGIYIYVYVVIYFPFRMSRPHSRHPYYDFSSLWLSPSFSVNAIHFKSSFSILVILILWLSSSPTKFQHFAEKWARRVNLVIIRPSTDNRCAAEPLTHSFCL